MKEKTELHLTMDRFVEEAKKKGARSIMVCIVPEDAMPIVASEFVQNPVTFVFVGLGGLEMIKRSVLDMLFRGATREERGSNLLLAPEKPEI